MRIISVGKYLAIETCDIILFLQTPYRSIFTFNVFNEKSERLYGKPFERSPSQGEKLSKRLGGNIVTVCEDKIS